jgi:hypothetical protein
MVMRPPCQCKCITRIIALLSGSLEPMTRLIPKK